VNDPNVQIRLPPIRTLVGTLIVVAVTVSVRSGKTDAKIDALRVEMQGEVNTLEHTRGGNQARSPNCAWKCTPG